MDLEWVVLTDPDLEGLMAPALADRADRCGDRRLHTEADADAA